MKGSLLVDGSVAEQVDRILMRFIQDNVFRGAVLVTEVTRGSNSGKGYYSVNFTGTLDALARPDEST